jgi:peptide deformylase
MILPIVAYGHPVLRQVCTDITPDYPELKKLLDDMWETMYNAHGMGLAAPQVNRPIRLFVFDTEQVYNNSDEEERKQFEGETGRKAIFINAHITALNGTPWSCDEGCLSLPGFREAVSRESTVTIQYCDENFVQKEETFTGLNARVILHEYDHIDGKLFIDRISLIRKKLLKKKLDDISAGRVKSGYKMILPTK